jgi:hypothetical protein
VTPEQTTEIEALKERLAAAERICVLTGWTPCQDTQRGKALHELWADWADAYGADAEARHGDELSDEYIAALARKRDETRRATLARIGLLET